MFAVLRDIGKTLNDNPSRFRYSRIIRTYPRRR